MKKTCWTDKTFETNQDLIHMPCEDMIVCRPLHKWNIFLVDKFQFKLETKRRINSSNTLEKKREIGEETIREYDDAPFGQMGQSKRAEVEPEKYYVGEKLKKGANRWHLQEDWRLVFGRK